MLRRQQGTIRSSPSTVWLGSRFSDPRNFLGWKTENEALHRQDDGENPWQDQGHSEIEVDSLGSSNDIAVQVPRLVRHGIPHLQHSPS